MVDKFSKISESMKFFSKEAPDHAKAWQTMITSINKSNPMEKKTSELLRIGILSALNITSGLPFHVISAKELGATREEIIYTVLAGISLAGNIVIQSLPIALKTYDEI